MKRKRTRDRDGIERELQRYKIHPYFSIWNARCPLHNIDVGSPPSVSRVPVVQSINAYGHFPKMKPINNYYMIFSLN